MKKRFLLKTMLLLCALVAGSSSVWADTAGFTLGSASSVPLAAGVSPQTTTITGSASETWNVEITGTWNSSSLQGSAPNKTWQMGKNGGAITSAIFSTSGITGTITSIVVNCSSYSAKAKVNCTVGGNNFGTQAQATPSWTTVGDVTFSGSASGTIVVTIDNSADGARAAYIQSITVTYSTGGSSVAQPTFLPGAGAVSAGSTITLSHATADAIRYTTDGTDPTKTTGTVYSMPIAITTPTTIKAIAVKGDAVSSVATAAYTISVTEPSFSPDGGSYMLGTTITLTSAGNTIYYNLTTDGSTPGNPTDASTKYTAPIAIGSGTAKIKAIAYDTYGNASSVAYCSYTGIVPTSLPFNWAGGTGTNIQKETGVAGNSLGDYGDTQGVYRTQLNATGDYILIYTDEKPFKVTIGVKMVGGSSTSKIKVQESANGIGDYANVEELTISGSQNTILNLETTQSFDATTRAIKLLFEKGSNVGVGPISIFSDDDIPVTITSAGWASFSNSSALDFTGTGVTPHIAKFKDASTVTLSPIAKVPAETGIVVNAPAGTYAIPVLTDAADVTTGNLLKPWLTAGEPTDGTYYTLAVDGSNPVFKQSTGGTLAANKAYLVMSGSSAPSLGVEINGETTGINDVRSQKSEVRGEVYNLAGQRVAQPTKGLYIVNGKKVVIK